MTTLSEGTHRRLMAQAAEARREAGRTHTARLAAEHAVREHERLERVRSLTDPHPEKAPSPEGLAAWEAIREQMRRMVAAHAWVVWCRPVHPHRFLDGTWVLACPASCHDWVLERFGSAWEAACEGPVRFVICDQSTSERGTA